MKFLIFNHHFSNKGFTLVEVLVGIFLILVIFSGLFAAYQLGLKVVGLSQSKIVATAAASAEIEKIRNLPYESVGISGGFPDGVLATSSVISRNNIEYLIERRADYVVDSADGVASPDDDCPNDYKRIEIQVSWQGLFGGEINLLTDIAPKNLAQECAELGGILSVSVFDALGIMVPVPLIEIKNPETEEIIKSAIPFEGKHYFSLATSTYKVVVSKSGYSSERTFDSGESYQGQTIVTPENPHPILLEGQLTEISFSIDELSSLTVQTRGAQGAGYPVVHNITFTLTGTKKVGLDGDDNAIYKYSQGHITNGPGQVTVSGLEWDAYSFSVDQAGGLNLISIESPPGTEAQQPLGLAPAEILSARLILSAENSLLVNVEDSVTLEPIFSASVRLFSVGYDQTQYTNEAGQTYFIPLEAGAYNLEVEGPGYNSVSSAVSVSGDVTKTIKLEQVE